MTHTVYILHSVSIDKFYIGYTSNMQQRLEIDLNPIKNKFTAKADDWTVFFMLECQSKTQALQVESHIKKMKSKTYINNLLKYPDISTKLLQKY